MKVVVNRCFGGFSISEKAAEFMASRGNKQAKAELRESKARKRLGKSFYWNGYGYSRLRRQGKHRGKTSFVVAMGASYNGSALSSHGGVLPCPPCMKEKSMLNPYNRKDF